ncbi:pseudouridine synthase [Rubellicoccus peritrichatus]|uniref:Pseudouridine synthase n=1 Tax=Rubellicoccus peritrichatus TaxID=3080537 RepID=A0AAQ3LAF8_9BACT|nr:pseudouridine synthase [Puniceicoccus sp. CR14]WOO41652.1 pseudouridine synthase [Puniceicoccus sp. CR14]
MGEKSKTADTVRLQKYIADAGICSRRKAEEMIREDRVTVNGKPAEIGMSVRQGDKVVVDGRGIGRKAPESLTLMMNKPRGVLCTNHDPHHYKTVFTLLPSEYLKYRLFCAGRLDKESEGLVIITNDGALANAITHPSGGVIKRYRVLLNKPLETKHIEKLLNGVTREGERLYAEKIIPASHGPDKEMRCEVHLQQGRKREIRRLFEAFGYHVKRLNRFQMGQLVLKKLAPGMARPLKPEELESLFRA